MSGPPELTYPRKHIAMLDHLFQELAYQGWQPPARLANSTARTASSLSSTADALIHAAFQM